MATVTYRDLSFECATALMGDTYVHLLDENGDMIVAFDGVTEFSLFGITGGEWSVPTPENDCYLAVLKDDGTIGKGGHKCCDIPTKLEKLGNVVVCETEPTELQEGMWYLIRAEV